MSPRPNCCLCGDGRGLSRPCPCCGAEPAPVNPTVRAWSEGVEALEQLEADAGSHVLLRRAARSSFKRGRMYKHDGRTSQRHTASIRL